MTSAGWWTTAVWVVVLLAVGFVFGQVVAWRRRGGVPVPYVPDTRRNITAVVIALSVLTLVSVVQANVTANTTFTCLEDYRRALVVDAEAGVAYDRADAAAGVAAEGLAQALAIRLELADPATGDDLEVAAARYRDGAARLQQVQTENIAARAATPIPTDPCK